MKSLSGIITILLFSFSIQSFGQTQATSTANGNWTMPTNWDCFCVPLPGDDVTIAHDIVLNTDWQTSNGSITINAGASLIHNSDGHDLLVSGGFITNNGTFGLRTLACSSGTITNSGTIQVEGDFANSATTTNNSSLVVEGAITNSSGTITNSGTIEVQGDFVNSATITNNGSLEAQGGVSNLNTFQNTGDVTGVDSLYTDGTLTNSGTMEVATFYNLDILDNQGTIFNVDSFYNTGTLTNAISGSIDADSALNDGTITNDGVFTHLAMTNRGAYTNNNRLNFNYFTNTGTFNNHDSIMGTASMTNSGTFTNHPDAVLTLGVSFLNANDITHNASFENNGYLEIDSSWYNFDQFSGSATGWVDVQDSSVNFGTMTGNFDFCDHTPNTILPPQSPTTGLDYNVGTVGGQITWCLLTDVAMADLNELSISPNPASDILHVDGLMLNDQVFLIDMLGKQLPVRRMNGAINLSDFGHGVYLLRVLQDDSVSETRLVISK